MWSDELTLISITYTEDEIGNQIPVPLVTTIFCKVKSIGRSEFYNASMAGLKPSVTFIVRPYEYNDETEIVYDTKNYKLIRTYKLNSEELELTCEKVQGNG